MFPEGRETIDLFSARAGCCRSRLLDGLFPRLAFLAKLFPQLIERLLVGPLPRFALSQTALRLVVDLFARSEILQRFLPGVLRVLVAESASSFETCLQSAQVVQLLVQRRDRRLQLLRL